MDILLNALNTNNIPFHNVNIENIQKINIRKFTFGLHFRKQPKNLITYNSTIIKRKVVCEVPKKSILE